MQSINRVILVGNLAFDPELRHTGGGTAVASLRVAVNGREKQGDEWVDRADFFDVTVFGNQAESCAQYLGKGSKVAVDGRLRQETWNDKETGAKRSKVTVTAQTVQFLNSKGDGGNSDYSDSSGSVPTRQMNDDFAAAASTGGLGDDDIPF